MFTEKNIHAGRSYEVHGVLSKENVLQGEDSTLPGVVDEINFMLDNFVDIAKSIPGSKRDVKSIVSRAVNQHEYVEKYLEGLEEAELRELILEKKWSTGQAIGTLALKHTGFYTRLYHRSRSGLYSPVREVAPVPKVIEIASPIKERKNVGNNQGLLPVLENLVSGNSIPPQYAESLKVLFGIADLPINMPVDDQERYLFRVRTLLIKHLGKVNLRFVDDTKITEGITYIERVAIGGSVDAIARLNKAGELDDNEVRRVQSVIANGLNAVYGGNQLRKPD